MLLGIRLLRFALVGTVCFLVQWCIVHFLRQDVHPFLADAIAFGLSAQLNFWLSKTITWSDRRPRDKRKLVVTWGYYNAVALLATVCNAVIFWMLIEPLTEIGALLMAGLGSGFFSFMLNHHVVFRGKSRVLLPEMRAVNLSEVAKHGIAVFMPAYNESDNLRGVVNEACGWLSSLHVPFNVIVVNDGSTDDTAETVRLLVQANPEVMLVSHEQNMGYGAALRTGFKTSLQTGHEWIAFCDSDGQFKPHEFGKLIETAVRNDADICIGYRIARADGLKRRLMGRGWYIVSRVWLGYKAVDVDCGFKVFRRNAVVSLERKLIGDHATISPEILARAHRNGEKIVEVGVNHYPRQFGEQTGSNLMVVVGSFKGLASVRRALKQETSEGMVQ